MENTPQLIAEHSALRAVVILQDARRRHAFASTPYRILDAAICHLIGTRSSSVDFAAPLEAK